MPLPALHFMYSCQISAKHFQQCTEFLPLRNRGLGPLAMTVLAIPLARRTAGKQRDARRPSLRHASPVSGEAVGFTPAASNRGRKANIKS